MDELRLAQMIAAAVEKALAPFTTALAALTEEVKAIKHKESEEVTALKADVVNLRAAVRHLEEKIDYQENQSRRENIIVGGIPEQGTGPEEWKDTLLKLVTTFQQNGIPIDPKMIHRAHRLHGDHRPRMIVAKFLNWTDKDQILRTAKRALSGTGVFVKEDFSEAVREKRKALKPIQEHAYKAKRKTYYKLDKLVVDSALFYVEENRIMGRSRDGAVEEVRSMKEAMALVDRGRKRAASGSPLVRQEQQRLRFDDTDDVPLAEHLAGADALLAAAAMVGDPPAHTEDAVDAVAAMAT